MHRVNSSQIRNGTVAISATLVLVACASAFAAGHPWENKNYERWTEKEVRQILDNSPWAKPATVPYAPQLNGDRPEFGDSIKIGNADDPRQNPLGPSDMANRPNATVLIRWNSSVTIRRALYRDAVLSGISPDAAADQFLKNEPESIEFVMTPTGGTLLPPTEPESLVPETYLELKPSGLRIEAVRARTRDSVDARGTHGYSFDFPRTLKNGERSIEANVTQVDFWCRMGVRLFHSAFKISEMVGADGRDLR